MEYQSTIEILQSQLKFYKALCVLFIVLVVAQIALASINKGPYVVQEKDSFFSVTESEPWKLTQVRIEGFLKLYLKVRMEWSKDDFESKRSLLNQIASDPVQTKLRESLNAFSAMAKSQDMRCFYVLEGYRFSNEKKIIEARVSRIIRVGNTGIVTPIQVAISYDESSVSKENPYGLKMISVEESEIKSGTVSPADGGSANS